jgi:uncharacterized protein YrrD
MLNVVRYSQLIGLIAVDASTASHLGEVRDVWLDELGRIAYLSSTSGYLPLEQVAAIATDAVSTYGNLLVSEPMYLHRIHRLAVQSTRGSSLGWIDDFLFDWQTGEIVAYILAGDVADSLGERAVLYPEDVQEILAETVIVREGATDRLQPETEGLKGFLSEKSHQVQHLVKVIGDRLHNLIASHDHPDVVRVKIKSVSDELANSGHHDYHSLREATEFLHEQWENLQQSISRTSSRARTALDAAWKYLTGGNSNDDTISKSH